MAPSSASSLDPTSGSAAVPPTGQPGMDFAPLRSLVASAQRIRSIRLGGKGKHARIGASGSWQEDAWTMYDNVGELRFLASTIANRVAQARLYVGRIPDDNVTEEPEPTDNPLVTDILDSLGGTPAGRAQIIRRLALNLNISGEGWIVGIPRHLLDPHATSTPGTTVTAPSDRDAGTVRSPGLSPFGADPNSVDSQGNSLADLDPLNPPTGPADGTPLSELDWRVLSVHEVSMSGTDDTLSIRVGDTEGAENLEVSPDEVVLFRVWSPHPAKLWEADSPTMSSLPVLRELVGLTMHISAQIDSRLAGAGILVVPASAKQAKVVGSQEDSASGSTPPDPLTEELIEAMLTPISDRDNASAVVPLVMTVPDNLVESFKHITFSTPLDEASTALREESIRRLALGMDAPPELLLGTADSNHWGAWLVREDVIDSHIKPPLALICDALTTQYLWPALIENGMSEAEAHTYAVWFDTSAMVVHPNRSANALNLYDKNVISAKAVRDASGFDETEAPETVEEMDPAVKHALDLITQAPSLMQEPGLPALVQQIRAALTGEDIEPPATPAPSTAPDTDEDDTTPASEGTDDSPASPGPNEPREPSTDLPATTPNEGAPVS